MIVSAADRPCTDLRREYSRVKFLCPVDRASLYNLVNENKLVHNILSIFRQLHVYGALHRNTDLIERTNKMQPCSRVYYSNVS
jgi:hypothetical protein